VKIVGLILIHRKGNIEFDEVAFGDNIYTLEVKLEERPATYNEREGVPEK